MGGKENQLMSRSWLVRSLEREQNHCMLFLLYFVWLKLLPSNRLAEVMVKDFPAENKATSKWRIAFLKILCGVPKFKALVDLVPPMVRMFLAYEYMWNFYLFGFQSKASAIPANYPLWVSWSSWEAYLPVKFHSAGAFKKALSILWKSLLDSEVFEDGRIDAPLLLLGLMYREVSCSMEMEPDSTAKVPIHLMNSNFEIKEINEIERLLVDIPLPSTK